MNVRASTSLSAASHHVRLPCPRVMKREDPGRYANSQAEDFIDSPVVVIVVGAVIEVVVVIVVVVGVVDE